VFLGAGRAALLQLAHPWVAAALAEHSTVMDRPMARFHNTFRIVFTMVFGSLDQALGAARYLYGLHTRIGGELTEDVAGWRRGMHYEANEVSALRWVYATLVESAVLAYESALGPLGETERQRYFAESRTLAGLFGIPAEALPKDWAGLVAYMEQMYPSDELGVSASARGMAQNLLAGAGSWIHPPQWYGALTAGWLPERLRTEFGLEFGAEERHAAERGARWFSAVYRKLPAALRYTGPWHEACARLEGRWAGIAARVGNRFWIGEWRMPFGEESVLRRDAGETTIAE